MRVKALVEYLGGSHVGWQRQPDLPSIQSELEEAIVTATGENARVEGAGRTDSGVHAAGQVAAFDLADGTDLHRLRASLNGLTAVEISVLSLEEVEAGFDPRRDARLRTYGYTVVAGRPPSPLLAGRCWYLPAALDPGLLGRLAAAVAGRHDFSAFRAADCASPTTVRDVALSQWQHDEGRFLYRISANAFLKQMVRVLVGSMVDVALAKLDERDFVSLLDGGSRERAGRTAPAAGLTLLRVDY